jgi:signal transduction histidine kinase
MARFTPLATPRTRVEQSFGLAAEGFVEMPDVAAVPELRAYMPAGLVSSYVCVPLRRDGRLLGLLTVGYTQRRGRFSRRQIALMRGLAHHAVAALENARLVSSLRDVNLVQRDFVAAVSHDLRTPLHILIGYNDMLLEGAAGDLQPAQRDLVGRVRECCGNFLGLIEDILEVARLDAGHDRRQTGPLDLPDLCRTLAEEVEELRQSDVVLRWTATPATIEADAPKIKMILRNLVTNALKFTTAGHVEMTAVLEAGQLVLRVADTGPRCSIRAMRGDARAGRASGSVSIS